MVRSDRSGRVVEQPVRVINIEDHRRRSSPRRPYRTPLPLGLGELVDRTPSRRSTNTRRTQNRPSRRHETADEREARRRGVSSAALRASRGCPSRRGHPVERCCELCHDPPLTCPWCQRAQVTNRPRYCYVCHKRLKCERCVRSRRHR